MNGKKMKLISGIFTLSIMCACIALTPGCATKLEQGGAYAPITTNADGTVMATAQPDIGLFAADASFDLAVSALDTAFKFERDNRALLWKISPEIKHGMDAIRPKAVEVKLKYAVARSAYLANPIAPSLDTLQQVLAEAKALSAAAQAVLPKS
jgi:hypothetical protein